MAKILIVEDEKSYCDHLKQILEFEGFEVAAECTSLEGIVTAMNFTPDVLIVDWLLKHYYDGLDLTKMLQQLNPDLKVIVMTGDPGPILDIKKTLVDVECVMTKPLIIEDLIRVLHDVIGALPSAHTSPSEG